MPDVPDYDARKNAHDLGKHEIEKRFKRMGFSEKETREKAAKEQDEASKRADEHWERVKRGE